MRRRGRLPADNHDPARLRRLLQASEEPAQRFLHAAQAFRALMEAVEDIRTGFLQLVDGGEAVTAMLSRAVDRMVVLLLNLGPWSSTDPDNCPRSILHVL